MTSEKPRRLGRGLEALISATGVPAQVATVHGERAFQRIPVAQIRPNPYQPRKEFRPEELADLEASLRENGLLQPITVRQAPEGSGFELIAGERRLRAANRLGWNDIPAIIREVDDRTLLTLALVENLQRADLNPIEEAEGYQRLSAEFELTQQQIAEIVGKDRSTVANSLRLLNLPDDIQAMLQRGDLSVGHARALLGLSNADAMRQLAKQTLAEGLTVRDVERRVRQIVSQPSTADQETPYRIAAPPVRDPNVRRLEDQLRRRLQTDVQVSVAGDNKGMLKIPFYSADDLDRLLDLILGPEREQL